MLFWLALILFLFVVVAMTVLAHGNRKIRFLRDLPAALPARPPRVSLVIAARDEASSIEAALDSLLAQALCFLRPFAALKANQAWERVAWS